MTRSDAAPTLPVLSPTSLEWVVVLEGVDHPHLARAAEAWHDGDGALHLQVDVPHALTLECWAAARGPMEPGEAVTVLLPVLAAVGHLLHRGVPVVGLNVAGVLVDPRGTPVLARAELGDVSAPGGDPGLAGVVAFVTTVLDRVRGPHGLEPPTPSVAQATQLVEVVELVHDLAEPLPLATVAPGPAGAPARDDGQVEVTGPPAWTALLPESEVVERALAWWARSGPRGVVAALRVVRPRFWATGVVGVGALVASTALFGGAGSGTAPAAGDPVVAGPSASATARATPDGPPASLPLAEGPPDLEAGAGTERSDGTSADEAVLGDDPGAAATVLLSAREVCLRELDGACLREVDHAASPLLGDDLTFLAEPAGVAPVSGGCGDLAETARWGGSALLRCERDGTTAASVLVVRTEAGWRLREIAPSGERP